MRRHPRLDATQKSIVAALRAAGYSVYSLAACGGGLPDILTGGHGVTVLIEAKSACGMSKRTGKPRAHGAANAATLARQQSFRERWRGGPVIVASSAEEAVKAVQATHGGSA